MACPAATHPAGLRENCWDTSNKGIYCDQAYQIGDMHFENVDITGFLGEAFYTGSTWSQPDWTVGNKCYLRNVSVRHTNGQALNPNGPLLLDVENFYAENCGFTWEGWGGGAYSRLVNAYFRKCGSGGISGSVIYDNPLRRDGSQPVCIIDAVFEDCGEIYIGSYVHGRMRLIDTSLAFVAQSDTMAIKNNDLDVTLQVHTRDLNQAVRFSGRGTAGLKTISNNTVRLNVIRSKEAEAGGYKCSAMLNQTGSLGANNLVYLRGYARSIGSTTDVVDNYVGIVDAGMDTNWNWFGVPFDPTTTPSPKMGAGWMSPTTFSSKATYSGVNLPSTALFPNNAEIVVEHRDAGNASKLVAIRDTGVERVLVGYKDTAKFRCNKYKLKWDLVNAVPYKSVTANIDIGLTALGELSGPYTISAPGCRPHHRVSVALAQSNMMPAGFVMDAVRAETDTVTFWIRNIDGTDPADPAPANFTARWWNDPN
ncbi:hypothetical protein OSJ57_18595 [Sphingomonas sp. HH69]